MLRGATGTRLGREDVAMWRVNLLANMEYRLDACADGLYDGAQLVLTDEDGATLSHADPGSETSLTFTPAETGVYYVGLYAEDLPEGVARRRVDVNSLPLSQRSAAGHSVGLHPASAVQANALPKASAV